PILSLSLPLPPISTLFPYPTLFRSALLTLMAEGRFDAASMNDPAFRRLFDRDNLLDSDWYQERLKTHQKVETNRLRRQIEDLEQDRKSTRLNSSHVKTSYAVFCLKK